MVGEIVDNQAPVVETPAITETPVVEPVNPVADAPAPVEPAPLTEEQHESLRAKIEELPTEIAAWVKKVIAEAKARI